MAVGEILLSAFFQVLFDRLACSEFLNFIRQLPGGFDSELNNWEQKLKMIQAVLDDAEEKQLMDKAVKLWLEDLQDLAYDAEDILDEFATEALKRKGQHHLMHSAFNFFNIKFSASMLSKIEDISSRLEHLSKQKLELGLQLTSGGVSSSLSTDALRRPASSSVPTDRVLYGRDEDKASVLKLLFSDGPNDGNFLVIPIVGMAGIGKTTLAREVYNDKAVGDFKFDIKAWVCVSDDFDILRISKALLESIKHEICHFTTLDEVQVQLREAVNGKKFLLVLDDVWNKNYSKWEDLKAPLLNVAPKSKIIVTTRNSDVALLMGRSEPYNLKHLSDEDCWSMFLKHAFEGSVNIAHQISEFRDKIVRKCGGLPLAAKTLGGLLRNKRDVDAWDSILNSNVLDFSEENDILPVLKLSYHYLPSHLKRCFAYCAIFPKDYEFTKKEVVLLWMAEGIIGRPRDDKQLEDWGSDCFDDLVSRSIFQQSNNGSSKFAMHDLVHDLAQLISIETVFRLDMNNKLSRKFQRVRHSSYARDLLEARKKFEIFHKFEYVRTFLPIHTRGSHTSSNVSISTLSTLLPKFKKLRVLSLQGYRIRELPFSLKDFSLLRYLNLASTNIRNLPETTSSLMNLQILILRNCYRLIKLPPKLRNLISLHYLDIEGAILLKEMPHGMDNLKNLRTLSNFIVGKGKMVSPLKDLKNLNLLSGELCISGLENLSNSKDAREALLCEKQNLEALSLLWGAQFGNSRDETGEENVLDMLQPHRSIKRLTIRYYGGARFPFWIGHQSFSKMEVVRLENCNNCKTLPSLGLLGSLKHLTIRGFRSLKSINSEFCGDGCSKPFRSLETLCLENLAELEYWNPNVNENEIAEIFSCLRELSVEWCPKFSGKLPEHLPSLEKLVVCECAELIVPISTFPLLCKLEIFKCRGMVCSTTLVDSKSIKSVNISSSALYLEGCKGMLYSSTRTELLKFVTISNMFDYGKYLTQGFQTVDTLAIGCHDLSKAQGLHISAYTDDELSIEENCISLVSFPWANFLPSNLRYLKIQDSRALRPLPEEMTGNSSQLERLYICGCDSLTFIAKRMLPSSLKSLDIRHCSNLLRLVDDEEDSSSSSSARIQSLESLVISSCPKLGSLPDVLHNLNCLQGIYLRGCSSLVFFPERGLPSTISNVSIINCENLRALHTDIHKLNSLRYLTITKCPSITSFPEEGFPTSLIALDIGNLKFYKAVIHWGLHRLTSLRSLLIEGCDNNAESFPEEQNGMMLPPSLTYLRIRGFQNLKYLFSTGFQNLTSLQILGIHDCPNLKSLPDWGLPSSLGALSIVGCPLLKKKCKRDKGTEWSKISHIPIVKIDRKSIFGP
ncbi:Disease resistance protein [Melia azedarach]|uniref:Disease resistance protein n=1 Tax=Melia azedarach TaxID=155640 RepID=A0ACC1YD75_MELAZ|nr:Disease resistance protein [Melia azedarach]